MSVYVTFLTIVLSLTLSVLPISAQEATTLTVFTEGAFPFSFTSDGRYMITIRAEPPAIINESTLYDTFIDVYETSGFTRVAAHDVSDTAGEFLAISHDAQWIAFVDQGGLYLLDRQTGAITQETANFYEFESLEFNPVNNLLAYVIGRGITVFDPTDPAIQYELLDDVYGGTIASLAWSPDGRYLANGVYRAGSDTFDVLLWDVTSLDEPIVYEPTLALEGAEPNHVAWRDANTLAAFGEAGIMIYDIPTRSMITFIENPDGLVWSDGDWSPDGTKLIAAGGNRAAEQPTPVIQVWDVSNLPSYESISYQEGTIGADIYWLLTGLFYSSRGGLRLNGEFLAPQLTATAQAALTQDPDLYPTPTPTPVS